MQIGHADLEFDKRMEMRLFYIFLIFPLFANAANYLDIPIARQHIAKAPVVISVTSTSSTGITENASRTGLECTNTGSVDIHLAFGANAATLTGGTVMQPGVTRWMDDYSFTTQAINVISASSSSLSCTEYQ